MFSFVIVVFVNVQMNSPSGYLFYIVIFSLVISRELQNNNIIVTNNCSAHIVCMHKCWIWRIGCGSVRGWRWRVCEIGLLIILIRINTSLTRTYLMCLIGDLFKLSDIVYVFSGWKVVVCCYHVYGRIHVFNSTALVQVYPVLMICSLVFVFRWFLVGFIMP